MRDDLKLHLIGGLGLLAYGALLWWVATTHGLGPTLAAATTIGAAVISARSPSISAACWSHLAPAVSAGTYRSMRCMTSPAASSTTTDCQRDSGAGPA